MILVSLCYVSVWRERDKRKKRKINVWPLNSNTYFSRSRHKSTCTWIRKSRFNMLRGTDEWMMGELLLPLFEYLCVNYLSSHSELWAVDVRNEWLSNIFFFCHTKGNKTATGFSLNISQCLFLLLPVSTFFVFSATSPPCGSPVTLTKQYASIKSFLPHSTNKCVLGGKLKVL